MLDDGEVCFDGFDLGLDSNIEQFGPRAKGFRKPPINQLGLFPKVLSDRLVLQLSLERGQAFFNRLLRHGRLHCETRADDGSIVSE